ncbi:MAG: hypothetical protein HZA53_04180, partial [Planctomycetes bacterium]|nr:hypothetical protein [Planctomycetota bacterium]
MRTARGRQFVLVAALLGAVAWVLQHRARSWLEGEGRWSGGGEAMALDDERLRHAVWDAPRAAIVDDAARGVTRFALAPDGRTVVFAAGERGLNA